MLGRLLARAVNDVSSQDLHDRALLYHRLLKHDPEVARRVCCCEKPPVSGEFAEDRDTGKLGSVEEIKDKNKDRVNEGAWCSVFFLRPQGVRIAHCNM